MQMHLQGVGAGNGWTEDGAVASTPQNRCVSSMRGALWEWMEVQIQREEDEESVIRARLEKYFEDANKIEAVMGELFIRIDGD